MDDIFAFIGRLYLGIHFTRAKKIDYIFKIQWKEQPVLFGIIILLFWFFALDSFYDTIDLFGLSPFPGGRCNFCTSTPFSQSSLSQQ